MAELLELGARIGESKAGPAGVLSCSWGYGAVARSTTSRATRRDIAMQVIGNVTLLGDGRRRGKLDCRGRSTPQNWKLSWEHGDGRECCDWFREPSTQSTLAGRCSKKSQPSETSEGGAEGRASSAAEIGDRVEDWDKFNTLFHRCYENASRSDDGTVQGGPERQAGGDFSSPLSLNGNDARNHSGLNAGSSRGNPPAFLDIDIRDQDVWNMGSRSSLLPRRRKAAVEDSREAAFVRVNDDEVELFEDEQWDSDDDYGIDLARDAGRNSVRVVSVTKNTDKSTDLHGNHSGIPPNDHRSLRSGTQRHVDESELGGPAFLRSRKVVASSNFDSETHWHSNERTPRYSDNAGFEEPERTLNFSPREELAEEEEEDFLCDRETSSSFATHAVNAKDRPRDVGQDHAPARAPSGRSRTDHNRRSTRDEPITGSRLQALEPEVADLLNGRSKDKDVSSWKAIKKVDSTLAKFSDGPVLTRSSLIAKQVISQESAMSLGFVVQMWVEMNPWKVVAIEVRPSMLFGLVEAILLQNLSQIGDVILVPDEDVLEGELDWTGCQPVVGFDIFTENALYLGKVRDFEFSLESGNVTSLEFDSFGVPLIPSSVVSTFSLPVTEIVETGEDCLLVRAGAERRMQVLTKGLWGRLSGGGGGDGAPSKKKNVDSRLVPKSGSKRSSPSREGSNRLSRDDYSRAQEIADVYVSSRGSRGHGSRGMEREYQNDVDTYIRKQAPRTPDAIDRQARRSSSRVGHRSSGETVSNFDVSG